MNAQGIIHEGSGYPPPRRGSPFVGEIVLLARVPLRRSEAVTRSR